MKTQSAMKDNKETTYKLDKITLKFLACFMISLMLTMPVYISSVYAPDDELEEGVEGKIMSVSATGSEGYTSTKEDDFINLAITLIYTKEAFDESYVSVKFNDGPAINPESCTA